VQGPASGPSRAAAPGVQPGRTRLRRFGLLKGFNCLFNPRVPHVHRTPLFQAVPELDPAKGGTLIGSSRGYIDAEQGAELDEIT
jgi:6-phosphofructokinase 1